LLTAETGKMLNGLINSMRQNDQGKPPKAGGISARDQTPAGDWRRT
jgi:hypothetical protein